jgi:hypothetical protein
VPYYDQGANLRLVAAFRNSRFATHQKRSSRMNDRGNRYALSALTKRRGELTTEIATLERQLRHRKELKVHIDATLKLLNPAVDLDKIKNRRSARRVKLIRQGELGCTILDALRKAGGQPVTTRYVIDEILAAGGHGESARRVVAARVRSNLAYLEKRGTVSKMGTHTGARWILRGSPHIP